MKTKLFLLVLASIGYYGYSQTGILVTSGVGGQSGLKFANINSSTGTTASNGKVLSVNTSGDVILVPDQTASPGSGLVGANNGLSVSGTNAQLGGLFGSATSAQLLNSREIPQGGNGLLFSGTNSADLFQVGGNAFGSAARFSVEHHNGSAFYWSKAISCVSDADGSTYNNGIMCQVFDKSSSVFSPNNMGIYVDVFGQGVQKGAIIKSRAIPSSNSNLVYGLEVTSTAQNSSANPYGIYSSASGSGPNLISYGVFGTAQGAKDNIGGRFEAGQYNSSQSQQKNIGVSTSGHDTPYENYGAQNTAWSGVNSNVANFGTFSSANDNAPSPVTNVSNYGVKTNGLGSSNCSSCFNYGVNTVGGGNNSTNYGVKSHASGVNSTNYGIHTSAGGPGPLNIGIYSTINPIANSAVKNWAGYFDGDVYIKGTSGGGGVGIYALYVDGEAWSTIAWSGSDTRYKKNITPLTDISSKLSKLKGYTYNFRTEEFKDKNFPQTEQIGLIAQELKEVFPQLVKEDNSGYLAVNYQGMVPVLLEAFKEQQQQIEELKTLVQSLAGNSANKNSDGSKSTNFTLSDKNVLVLDQNVPNPFAESTVISYNIPEDFTKAQIIFMTNEGKVIKSLDITEKGAGSLNVFANDLSHGMYSYSLIIDGKTVATKKMIKE